MKKIVEYIHVILFSLLFWFLLFATSEVLLKLETFIFTPPNDVFLYLFEAFDFLVSVPIVLGELLAIYTIVDKIRKIIKR